MKSHEIALDELHSPGDVVAALKEKDVQQGDTVKLIADEDRRFAWVAIVVLFLAALVVYFHDKRKRQEEGDAILKDIFKGKSVDELEKEIEEEYGIHIEIEHRLDEERGFWQLAGNAAMVNAYGEDEPDYSNVPLMEPNPEYRKWNPEQ